ncbi:MAG: TetR/AcrR family transcriptional regulator [Microcella sp.]|uniref:TetR/AcrR family transcriptional regulator n=1 Tax=Microcella sp. TaxID=1913979 RepID=UPI0024C9A55F|nr:helix-turn-helix domain-containing protein [Microcella sp.]UYN83005.1 MAG: TetR/AcrR family transcriptional regulator [Microcella sp.]
MVQKKSNAARGRPSGYDLDEVVGRATAVFWAQGSDATSVDELERATHLNRSTIYTALGGKAGLFDRCVRAYVDSAENDLLAPAITGTSGVDDLVALVSRVADMLDSTQHPPGCFAIRSLVRGDGGEQVDRYREALRRAITATLRRAVDLDDLDPALGSSRAALVEAALLGMLAVGRSGGHDPRLLAGGLMEQIRHWRPPSSIDSAR